MSTHPTFRTLPVTAAVAFALFATAPKATAQEVEEKASAREDIEKVQVVGSYTVAEVIDTATGLGLTLRETPQSVSVITLQRIQDQALDTITDTVINAVGVASKEIDNVRNTLQARGFDISNYQIDGVPLSWSLAGDSGETIADVAIYERVEFVRGATGLLTGAGDPSASINLVRKHANAVDFSGYVNAAIGSRNNRELSTDLASGLNQSGTLRGRLVAKYEEGDGHEDRFETQSSVLYGVIEGDLTSNTLVRLGASYQNNDPTSPTWGALPSFFSDGTATDWHRSVSTSADWTKWETTNTNLFANVHHLLSNGWELVANYNRLKYEQDTKLVYISGVLEKDSGAGLTTWSYKSSGESIQDSFDIQLKGQYGLLGQTHDFVLGYLYSEQDADTYSFDVLPGAIAPIDNFYEWDGSFAEPQWGTTPSVAQAMDTEQKGLYGATRLSVSDNFKLIAGARLASWQRTGVSYGTATDFGNDDVLIPYAGALYDITDQHRLYTSYTEIFQPQNLQDKNGEFLKEVEGKSYEIGLKSSFLADALNTTVALFRIEQDNLGQVDPGQFIHGDPTKQAYVAAQGVTSKGFELEMVGRPLAGWNIHAGYSQFDAEDAAGADVNTDHPRKQLKLFTTYQFVDSLPQLTVGGGANWQDKTYSINGPVELRQGAYTLVNLMAKYQLLDSTYLQLNVDNLLDETYYSQIGFFSQYRYGAPRSVNLSLHHSF
ncbi:TonB-dependent siderophore receptor [Bowmanella denitrificans]|uniref:TonB-dependent siderophore receptor n=1 Tax=Bowmanella denitrificans TaxID=366582 RepID=UPI000C9BB8DC|nr:TonB-dependent siderophore receptor [Bowmanella denitrificans]